MAVLKGNVRNWNDMTSIVEEGDQIWMWRHNYRVKYAHVGVYVGEGNMIHVSQDGLYGIVKLEKAVDVIGKSKCFLVRPDAARKEAMSGSPTHRAFACLELKFLYSVTEGSCEVFVNCITQGIWTSDLATLQGKEHRHVDNTITTANALFKLKSRKKQRKDLLNQLAARLLSKGFNDGNKVQHARAGKGMQESGHGESENLTHGAARLSQPSPQSGPSNLSPDFPSAIPSSTNIPGHSRQYNVDDMDGAGLASFVLSPLNQVLSHNFRSENPLIGGGESMPSPMTTLTPRPIPTTGTTSKSTSRTSRPATSTSTTMAVSRPTGAISKTISTASKTSRTTSRPLTNPSRPRTTQFRPVTATSKPTTTSRLTTAISGPRPASIRPTVNAAGSKIELKQSIKAMASSKIHPIKSPMATIAPKTTAPKALPPFSRTSLPANRTKPPASSLGKRVPTKPGEPSKSLTKTTTEKSSETKKLPLDKPTAN